MLTSPSMKEDEETMPSDKAANESSPGKDRCIETSLHLSDSMFCSE